ncbi:C6 zinc finger domain containing protein [Pleurostoma richardsiae]|uniref:C6 zinc finger domain containing protein n=1 Tax=Pleurostoma richardsiae TaxID=41990 RepID=A0AA38R2H5_9PEZI|nr:C6 zinc finger domain containing protein [Pleurostoma richardsiae]
MTDRPSQKQQLKGSGQNLFQCSACKRTYTRVDHLARHVRSHLHERPFQCPTCNKAFGRLDLLKRHAACHQGDRDGKTNKSSHNQGPRVSQACRSCATAKLKCDDEKPCGRCQQRGITCEYAIEGHDRARSAASDRSQSDPVSPPGQPESNITVALDSSDATTKLSVLETMIQSQSSPAPEVPNEQMPNFQEYDMSGFLKGVMTPTVPNFPATWMEVDNFGPRGLLDFTSDWIDFNDADFGFLDQVTFVVKTFPTPELLDDLIECFFSNHRQQTDSFIHMPTFNPNQQQPELVAGMAAFGATMTDVRSLHKLGFAMQEAVRTTVPGRCEEANATTRELWLLQAFMCEIQIGMWSGIKRKMEIAESHTQIPHTMLRRAGRFHRLKRPTPEPVPQDTGNVLHRKWLEWAEQESLCRLVFHAFIFDAQVSMAMLTNPIISYSELSIPLPESRELWMAEDADQWKALFLSRPRSHSPQLNLLDFLQQPTELPENHDVHLSSLIILYGLWGMIWQHLQLASTLKRPGHTSPCVALRHQELLQTLHHFRINLHGCQSPPRPDTALLLELLHMHLHMHIGEMQLFAGKGDIEDARRVLPSLQQWVDSSESRQAIWHAGQVLRAANDFPPKQLCRFYAIAVYHAGLTLWVYGVISQCRVVRDKSFSQNPGAHAVCLDGPECPATQRFITLGKGIPGVGFRQGTDPAIGLVPLSDHEAVMDVVVDTLKNNFPTPLDTDEAPPLVQNLIQLLRDLGKAAGGIGT